MLDDRLESKLVDLCRRLIDQQKAKTLVRPNAPSGGYWFGGGNMTADADGNLYVVGRYRNQGDSRTGIAEGSRGLELAIFRSRDQGDSFEKILGLSKRDVCPKDARVLSIEGSALRFQNETVDLFVSTEKEGVGYPLEVQNYLKPGTGVWSIDRMTASSIEGLKTAIVQPVLTSSDPATIHVKDPFVYGTGRDARLFFCSHPFSWTCSNTGYLAIEPFASEDTPSNSSVVYDFFPRGNVWDVAMSRGTCIVDVPRTGSFAEQSVQLMFYDGGECVRNHTQHAESVSRPRGHSCEELGGVAYFTERNWSRSQRLSRNEPLFVSPFGTGSSRYVDVLTRPEGMYATWQQSQDDGSQPLVCHFVSTSEIESALA